jgi:DUF4097 and DUF4098 domain-containing protein YvlB
MRQVRKENSVKKLFLFGIAALMIPAISFASGAREEESFSYTGITRIEIRAMFLDVKVRGEYGDTVQMRSDLPEETFFAPREFKVRHEVVGSDLRVWVEKDGIFSGGSGALFFRVPSGSELNVESASGDVKISGISAVSLYAKSASGDLDVSDVDAAVMASTISGDLTARKLKGDLNLTTVSGDIDASGLKGRLSISSISGEISGDGILLELSSHFKTVSGNIRVDLDNALDELRYDLSTVSGRLTVGAVSAARSLALGSGSLVLKGESVSGSQAYR